VKRPTTADLLAGLRVERETEQAARLTSAVGDGHDVSEAAAEANR
jgi:hypothetical protein